jgi:hypothetical protein
MSETAIQKLEPAPSNVAPLRAGGRVTAIIPQSVEEVFRIAKAICASGLAPTGMKSVEQITVAIMYGAEIGLSPMMAVQRIAVVNGRPTIWGDAIPALLLARGFQIIETMDGEGDARGCTCKVVRPDGTEIERRFSIGDAKTAGLWGKAGPWKQYPDRMLQMRARSYAARDGAADVLSGLYLTEEAQDIQVGSERKSSAEGKRDGTVKRWNGLREQIAKAPDIETIGRIRAENAEEIATLPASWAHELEETIAFRLRDLEPSAASDQSAVLREIERALDSKPPEEVTREFSTAIMAMDEDGRETAMEMIKAKSE